MSQIYSKINFNELLSSTKKGDKRQIQIVETAIDIIYEMGLEGFTFELLSKRSQISRPLIYHYFPTLNELYLFMAALIRHNYQLGVISQMKNKVTLKDVLTAYIKGALTWFSHHPKEACVWLIYFVKCARSEEIASLNTKLVEMGTLRIQEIISVGILKGEFKLKQQDIPIVARRIQLLITGHLISWATERRSHKHWEVEFQETLNFCLSLVGC